MSVHLSHGSSGCSWMIRRIASHAARVPFIFRFCRIESLQCAVLSLDVPTPASFRSGSSEYGYWLASQRNRSANSSSFIFCQIPPLSPQPSLDATIATTSALNSGSLLIAGHTTDHPAFFACLIKTVAAIIALDRTYPDTGSGRDISDFAKDSASW